MCPAAIIFCSVAGVGRCQGQPDVNAVTGIWVVTTRVPSGILATDHEA